MMCVARIRRWMSGRFVCLKCGRPFIGNTFGSGSCICPECYDGEETFLFFDDLSALGVD